MQYAIHQQKRAFLFIALLSLAIVFGCSQKKEEPAAQQPAAQAQPAADTAATPTAKQVVDGVTGNQALQQGQNVINKVGQESNKHNADVDKALKEAEEGSK